MIRWREIYGDRTWLAKEHLRNQLGGLERVYLNQLEPKSLIDAFLEEPPEGFAPLKIGEDELATPAFFTPFDILTTFDDAQKWLAAVLRKLPIVNRWIKPNTLFVGTTVSEYSIFPKGVNASQLVSDLLHALKLLGGQLLIVKDIPLESPLLSESENSKARELILHLTENGFQIVAGMALAYVPIDFQSTREYLSRLSPRRRKEMKRKLRASSELKVEEIATGDARFNDPVLVKHMYDLYLNVYNQSKYHFDKLTLPFFSSLLANGDNGGIVFVYKVAGEMIGYNICFLYHESLIDKYIGFSYPQARDANLYFVSWFYNLEYAVRHKVKYYIAGWTDPEVKAALGARFTFTYQAIFLSNPLLRFMFGKVKRLFEADHNWANKESALIEENETPAGAGVEAAP